MYGLSHLEKTKHPTLPRASKTQVWKSVEEFVLSTYLAEGNGWMAFLIQTVS